MPIISLYTYLDLLSFSTISRKLTLLKSLQSKFSPNTVVMNNCIHRNKIIACTRLDMYIHAYV